MHFINKNVPTKQETEQNVPLKRDIGLMKLGFLLGLRIHFHISKFLFFNRILL